MLEVKVTAIGNSLGVLLPKDALAKLKVGKGDTLYLVENKEGFTLTPYQQDFASQMWAAEKVLKKSRNALHELAIRLKQPNQSHPISAT
jgi:putative addiction module antidote